MVNCSRYVDTLLRCIAFGFSFVAACAAAQSSNGVPQSSVVAGTITIVDKDGVEVEDRSDVVVFIDGVASQETSHHQMPVVSQMGRRFTPRVLPIVQGTAVEFPNDDDIFHNVFSLSKPRVFDLGIYPRATSKSVTFDQPGLVRVYCNIHPDMISTILVLKNELFDTTGPDGTFEIRNVPDGEVSLRVWSEFGEELTRQIVVHGGNRVEESFVISATKRLADHDNKFGRPYRAKY
jgi:plastocyanin